jgi:hypothetical protein
MPLKERFLLYVEQQRNAEEIKCQKGPHSPETRRAYAQANELKREVLNLIEELNNENSYYI